MRRLALLLLACALILIACIPTTHATGTDPDKPLPHLTTNLETPIVADDGGWIDYRTGQNVLDSSWSQFKRVLGVYYRIFSDVSVLTNSQLEAMPSQESGQSSPTKSSGSTNSR
jgi:energy-converting hydrogenase Eha subunit F